MSWLNREKKQEEARIGQLRRLLERVDEPGFWDRLSKYGSSSGDNADSFQRAVMKRAHELGATPQILLTLYGQGLSTSTYPTSDCLEAEEELAGSKLDPTHVTSHF